MTQSDFGSTWVGRALVALVDAVSLRPRVVLGGALLLSVAAAAYTATHLRVNADQDAMFSDELPHRVVEIEYVRRFPALYENVVVVVDAGSPAQAQDAALLLAEQMAGSPEFFRNVYLPRSDFFEQHALLYMATDELEDFADRLARVQPYLAGLGEDGSLRGLAMLLARGTRAAYEGDIAGSALAPIFEGLERAFTAAVAGEDYRFSWAEVVAGSALEGDETRRLILAQPVLDFGELAAARSSLEALRRMASDLGLEESHGARVRVTGDVALSYEEMDLVEDQAVLAGIASFVMVTGLLGFALRSVRFVLAIIGSLLAGLIGTAAFAAVAVGHLNLISIAFAVLFIGLAVDFSLHLCMRFQEVVAEDSGGEPVEVREALRRTVSGVGGSLVLCASTTTIGFFAFVPTDFAGVAELGLIAGAGMVIGLVATFTIVPAALALARPSAVRPLAPGRLPAFPTKYPVVVVVCAAILAVAALGALPELRFDQNPLHVRDPSAESVQTYEELLAEARSSPWGMATVAPDLESAESLAATLSALPVVEEVETVHDYIPDEQDVKLAIMRDASLFLAPRTGSAAEQQPSAEEQLSALREFDDELARLPRRLATGAGADSSSREHLELLARARALRAALRGFELFVAAADDQAAEVARLDRLEQSLVGSLPDQLDTLERLLAAEPVTLEALPDGLRRRMIAEDGGVRVVVHPAEDLEDAEALERFVEQVRAVAPDATGNAVNIHEASRAVVRALREALIAAVVVIAVLLFAIWRRPGDTALVLAPLLLAALLTSAASVWIGIPFNFADIIVLPLLLGIGVDSGIHLVHRARLGDFEGGSLLETSTARAVVFSALTTIASFGSLGFATHRGMASLGQLLTLGVALTVLCNVCVLPALIALRERRRA